jgi:hypothetical protein
MIEKDINRLSSFHNTCLRKIIKIFWPKKISNKDLHDITNTKDMETLLIQKRWRWLGHVLRKPSEDMTKVALRWTPEGKRKRGRPKTTWKRTIENEIKRIHLGHNRKKSQQQRRVEETCPCPMCIDANPFLVQSVTKS